MGNRHPQPSNQSSQSFNSYIPSADTEDKPSKGQNDISTGGLVENIETELLNINNTFRKLKGKHPHEARQQLTTMLSDTENALHHINKQIQTGGDRIQTRKQNEDLVESLLSQNEQLRREIENMKTLYKEEKKKLVKQEKKNTELLLRLSKESSDKLVKNNPSIADLSDKNRPTRLGEIYNELYDNEWTDAFEGLKKAGHDEDEAVVTLYLTLMSVLDFCRKKAETMLIKTDDAVNFLFKEYKISQETVSTTNTSAEKIDGGDITLQDRWIYKPGYESKESVRASMTVERSVTTLEKLKSFRKEVAETMVPVVQKAYLKASWKQGRFVSEIKPFIRKCIFLCWMMVVQSPPMSLHIMDVNKNIKFDKNMYKEYTTSGPQVKFVVWPPLLLQENGNIVCKGVAQGCSS